LVILLGVVYCPWIYQKIKKYPSVIWGKFTTKKNNTKEFSESIKIEQKPANKTNS
jgi:hypothetical protein